MPITCKCPVTPPPAPQGSEFCTFGATELVARVGRREMPPGNAPRESFRLEDMAIDYSQGRVTVGDRVVALTETGYRLLYELSVNAAQVLTREHLMRRVWSAREAGDAPVVRDYVLRLRKKLGETADDPKLIPR